MEGFNIISVEKGGDIVFQEDEGTDLYIVLKGRVKVSLSGNNGVSEIVDQPARAGIFTPVLVPKQAGDYKLEFEISFENISEKIDAGQFSGKNRPAR